jgi:predicted 3-demethylubiquinone-9 3-methyltransferase (glyoxalase superfamily)
MSIRQAQDKQKIVPHLWYNTQAKEAAEFYASVFSAQGGSASGGLNSKVTGVTQLHDTPSGDAEIVTFEVMGYTFMAISAGPLFAFNPSISFFVNFDPSHMEAAEEKLNEAWAKLTDGGKVLMELGEYPFSNWYGWIQDKYGLSWQLILTDPKGEERPMIVPSLLFVKNKNGKAKEARDFYLSVFRNAKEGAIAYYEEDTQFGQKKGDVMFSDFKLEDVWIAAMDGGDPHDFDFNEAISLMVYCDTQEEIDYYWEKLSADPKAEQCGWLKDKYGVSWQIVPTAMDDMMQNGTPEQIARVTQAFLKMKKFDIVELQKAYDG